MKKVIITGCTGSIGIALINHLIDLGIAVTAIVRPASLRLNSIPKSPLVDVVECDISCLCACLNQDFNKINKIAKINPANSENLNKILVQTKGIAGGYDVFYHFAWEGTFGDARNNMFMQSDNIKYTLDAVNLAQRLGCKTFVFAGSQAEYGRVAGTISPQTPTFPENGYGMAKLCAGTMSRVLCNKLNIKHIWARIVSVYGAFDGELTMITSTINKLLKGETPDFTACEQQWDYLYSKDAATAMYLVAEKGKNNQIYCLASGKSYPLRYFVETLRNAINPQAALNIGAIPYTEQQVMNLCVDIDNLRNDTGFVPKYSFEEGIKETILYEKIKNSI